MLIGEFAKRTGVTPDTIRFYEKVGFFAHVRQANGYRVYNDADVATAELIASGKSMGFSLREIHVFLEQMTRGAIDHSAAQQSLRDKIQLIDSRIASLRKARTLIQSQMGYCRQMELAERDSDTWPAARTGGYQAR